MVSAPSVTIIRRQCCHFELGISQTLVFLDFLKPVLDEHWHLQESKNSFLARQAPKDTKLWGLKSRPGLHHVGCRTKSPRKNPPRQNPLICSAILMNDNVVKAGQSCHWNAVITTKLTELHVHVVPNCFFLHVYVVLNCFRGTFST